MRFIGDLLLINLSAIAAFLIRQYFGDLIIKDAPSLFWPQYLQLLVVLDLFYPIVLWLLGLYDKRQKRALLEEFLLIFGVFSTSIAILIVFLFLGRLYWMSRIVLFTFWGLSILFLSAARIIYRGNKSRIGLVKLDLSQLINGLAEQKNRLEVKLREKVSIIIVSTNEIGKLKKCLDSIKMAQIKLPLEVIVIDNQSLDGTEDYLKMNCPEAKVLVNKKRLGYSANVNLGLKAASANYCLVLNPDVAVIPGSIEVMLDYLISNPRVGIAGCKLLNEDGTLQTSVRRFLDFRTYLYRFTPLRGLMAGSAIERYYLMHDWDHNDNRLVDWVLGGCMLVRRKAWEEVGMMDECFFLYFDDVDWCFRMWERGWQVAYVADAVMIHKHMRTSANKLFSRETREHFKSLFKFILKHGFRLPANCPSSIE
ncbi:MAG: glycosyltransferase [Candidatus Margulisbacteria bacterium]|nr:glycosyltransferase [Candidatus Margulisiibacteriota bacterium]